MKIGFVRSLGIASVGFVGACSSTTGPILEPTPVPKFTCTSNSATMRLPAELRATLRAFGPREPDDFFVSVSRTVPGGFAGLFRENDRWILTFVDPAAANSARAEIQRALDTKGGYPYLTPLTVEGAEFRSARWTFAELDEWYRYIWFNGSPFTSGAHTSDIDERANTINFSVVDEAARANVEASLGVSCNLVTTTIAPMPSLLN